MEYMEFSQRISYATCKERVKSLLEDLNNDELTKRVEAITMLGNVLSETPQARDYFHELNGKNAIFYRLLTEEKRKFVEAALFTLANSTINHMENQNSLIEENVFDLLYTIIRQPNIMELPQFSYGTIYLISTIVYQNSAGQHLVRESGCLNQLLYLFRQVLCTAWKIQNPGKELKNLDIICHALYLSVNNPKNEDNQKQVAVVFPKALLYLSFLIFDNKMRNEDVLPFLRLFIGTLSGNIATQESFIECGGMAFVKRLLLDKKSMLEEESLESCIMLMDLLIASKRFPSSEVPPSSIVKLLVDILQNNKCKLVTLFLLFHLMENDSKMQEEFIKSDGPEIMKQICLEEVENEEIEWIVAGIWAMILKNNLELSKACLNPGTSKMGESQLENGIEMNGKEPVEQSCRMESPQSSDSSSINTFDMTKNFDKRLPKAYKNMHKNDEVQIIHESISSISSLRKNITVDILRESDESKAPKLSPAVSIKTGTKRNIHLELDESKAPKLSPAVSIKSGSKRNILIESDESKAPKLSPAVSIKAGSKRNIPLELDESKAPKLSPAVSIKAGTKGNILIESDENKAPKLSPAVSIKAGTKRNILIELDESKAPKLSPAVSIKAGTKRKVESPCRYSPVDDRIRCESAAMQTKNHSPLDNTKADLKSELVIPFEDFNVVEKIKNESHVLETLKPSSANNSMFGIKRKMITSCKDFEIDTKMRDVCIRNECMPITPPSQNGFIIQSNRKNCHYSNKCTDELQSGLKLETSGLHNIPVEVTNLGRNINVEILKTPTGFQINLNSNGNKELITTVKGSRTFGCESRISQLKKICYNSNIHNATQDKATVVLENEEAAENNDLDILDHKSNGMIISTPEVIDLQSGDSDTDESSVVFLSQERKVDDNKKLKCKLQSSEGNMKIENESILTITHENGVRNTIHVNMEKKEREVENGLFCPIISSTSQEINSEIGYWYDSKCSSQNDRSKLLNEMEIKLEDGKFQSTVEGIEDSKTSIDFVKDSSINHRKELMIPRGQKRRWTAQKGSLPQIPFTRQEIANLNAGIKEFGLNFIDIRKNYKFLSTRTSKDLFVAWRDGLELGYQGNRKMISLSSDDSYLSDD